jgi:two-component system, NarL family, nitrate/nitrite response regulator NarL
MVLKNANKPVMEIWHQISDDKELLLKQLVKNIPAPIPSRVFQTSRTSVNEVILEVEVDGIQYCLVRCKPNDADHVNLSSRELAIAKLIAQGFSNKCIGNNLRISQWTVNTYLRRIFSKLGVTSRAAMVMRLMEAGLLQQTE